MAGTVLILAAGDDGEARRVSAALERRGKKVAWLDLAWFPQRALVSASLGVGGWAGRIATSDGVIDLAEIDAVYYRHLAPFELPDGLSRPERRFALVEARFGLGGILASLPVQWVSHPSAVADAEYKPAQLAAGMRAGFTVPPTWMGNDSAAARAFIEHQPGGAVYKAIMHKVFSEDNEVRALYTSAAEPRDVDERIGVTMHQFQARMRGVDVRALVTTRGAEAVEITYRDEGRHLDYRAHYDAVEYRRTRLDQHTEECCRRLLGELGLAAGIVDLVVTDHGIRLYEVNPSGAWAWLEEETGAPMAELVAEALEAA